MKRASTLLIMAFMALALAGCWQEDETLSWAQNLTAESVVAIEAVRMPFLEGARYKKYEKADFGRIVALINEAKGVRLDAPEAAEETSLTFYVTTAEGERHTFSNDGDAYLVIDGAYYEVDIHWLKRWGGEAVDGAVPEGFEF